MKSQKKDTPPRCYKDHNEFYGGADLYVFRYKQMPDGEWVIRNSKPCADCTQIIKKSGIKRVYYSVYENNEWGVEKVKASELESEHVSFGRRAYK